MDLNPRKLRILKTIIDEYILSAAPVGSKFIAENVSFRVSPAPSATKWQIWRSLDIWSSLTPRRGGSLRIKRTGCM